MSLARFAYDRSGSVLACVDQAEVLVYSGTDEHPLWRQTCAAPLTAIGTTVGEVVGVDVEGRLQRWEAASGAKLDGVELGAPACGLAVARDGTAAVLLTDAVQLVVGGQLSRRLPVPGASSVAIRDDGGALAVGTQRGRVHVFEARTGTESGMADLGGEVRGLCWNVRSFWLAAVGDRLFRVSAEGGESSSLLRAAGRVPDQLTCSADGGLIACQMTADELHVISLPDQVGTLRYQRRIEGLAFGPDVWLGVGLDQGDGNKINLATGACHRTDPHPGRAHNAWTVDIKLDKARIKEGRSTANPSAEAVRAKLAEKRAASATGNRTTLYVVGALVLAAGVAVIAALALR